MNESMHLFAGIGGGLLSDLIIGHNPIIAVEWDKYACRVLRERAKDGWFPDLSVYEGDVRLFDPSEYAGRIHTLHAGFPCQDISNAGKQAGLGEGTRSGLYREVLRIAGVVRPREIYLENVSAILSNGLGTVLGDLAALGYDAKWICVRASDVGANHQRDRWWLLARRSELSSHAEHNRDGRREQQQEGVEGAAELPNSGGEGIHEHGGFNDAISKMRDIRGNECISVSGKPQKEDGYLGIEQLTGCGEGNQWNEVESRMGRVADDVSDRVGKLKGLGNAMVPLQAAVAYKMLERLYERP